MTLTGNVKLRSVSVNGDFEAKTEGAIIAEVAEAYAMTPSSAIAGAESGDWAYSATAEGRTGEVAVNGIDVDDEPGMIYTGPPGGAFRVKVTNFDVVDGDIATEDTDTMAMAILLNNTVVAFADEGFVAELDISVESNVDTYVGGMISGDVIRVALIGGGEETLDLTVSEGGTLDIV